MLFPRMGEVGGVCIIHTHLLWSTFDDSTRDRAGVTELSRLTSDPICTADRRGGILISFGRIPTLGRVLNPFERRVRADGANRPRRTSFAFTSEPSYTLKGVGSLPRRKPQPAGHCAIIAERPETYKGNGSGSVCPDLDPCQYVEGTDVMCLPPCQRPEGTWRPAPRRSHSH